MAATTSSFLGMGERPGAPPVSGLPRLSARIGKYEVDAEIGQSAAVKVFRALDRDTGRPVTLKVLTDVADHALVERFRREIATAAGLRNRSFIAIYELGEHVGLPFAAMQHLDGNDLRGAIQTQRSLTLLQKMLIMWQVADGVQAAYRGGLSYVGIRPSGIALASDGSVTIRDFGIVRLGGIETDDAAFYQAPEELVEAGSPDELCDIFAWGEVYYELLTGNHPFLVENSGELNIDLLHQEPARVRDLAPDCPEALERLVHRALEKQRELRYQSMDDVGFDAEPILRDLKRSRAAVLSKEARRLMDAQNLDEAQGVLREVLELDPDNQTAHRLRSAAQDLLQRRRVQPRVQALLREAEEEIASQRFARAAEILKAAVRLDSTNADAKNRLEQVLVRLSQIQKCAQLVAEGRRLLEQRNLTEAHDRASAALELDPYHAEAAELQETISQTILREEAETKIEHQLAKAKSLLLLQSFDEALTVLEDLRAEFPDYPIVYSWLAHVEEQKKEAAVRRVTEEAQWLVGQDRPDLAAQLLREKLVGLPGQPELLTHLSALEKTLPGWEERRFIQDALTRSAGLEQAQQWSVALTVLQEALETCPDSVELQEAAEQLRVVLRGQEVQKKLARRLDAIAQKMSAGAWQQAIPLIESALLEFPGEPELQTLLEETRASLKRSECEAAAAEVRRCLADGETEQAAAILRTAIELLGEEPILRDLQEELEADKRYREEWRTAQILFGRRQLREAEQILTRLVAQKRPDALALLDAVREARSASEEEDFYNRGREKALKLIQQQQMEQAADLLRNLLSLFPGDPILERDLQSVQNQRASQPAVPLAATAPAPPVPAPSENAKHKESTQRPVAAVPLPAPWLMAAARGRFAVIGLLALLLVIAATVAIWGPARHPSSPAKATVAAPVPQKPATTNVPVKAPILETLPSAAKIEPAPAKPAAPVAAKPAAETKPVAEKNTPEANSATPVLKPFNPPPAQAARAQAPVIAPPSPTVAASAAPGLPANVLPAPTVPAEPGRVLVPDPGPAPRAEGGHVTQPKLISRVVPVLPTLAKARNVYGTVKLEATVDKQGHLGNVKTVSGNPMLIPVAREAVLQWRYEPATLNGQPTESPVEIQITFEPGRN
ncbi:MAG TPA: TonB family protein [Bryobacteraceae bacterium]|nr:TonB family protein [Bryobacteraceae bacterium]